VAKILVADDNSNIQKMVGLALKDHGIEVVAVGNGEAAVRKISDIRPDLVLADVFMPVRNGYEVCQYVKQDASLAHIPVILLVGAFDPLDEQEAQRVGADGVLKKPFVPPDPLISMVKSALVRAGVAHAGFAPAKPVLEAPVEAPAPAPPVPNFAPKPVANLPGFETESFAEVVPARPAALKIESGQQPVAFGSLLETPGTDTEEELNEVTAVPALERDWHPEEADEEGEEEDAEANPSWRRDAGSEDAEVAASDGAGRDAGSEQSRGHGKKNSIWTPTREKTDLAEPAEVQANALDARSDFRNISAAPFAGEAWAAAIDAGVQNKTAVAEEEHPAPHAADLEALVGHAEPAPHEQSFVSEHRSVPTSSAHEQSFISERAPEPEAAPEPTPEPVEEQATFVSAAIGKPEKPSATPSWFSTPPSPWDAEAQKASKLASIWDMPIVSASVEAPAQAPAPEPADAPNSFAAAPDEIEVLSADTGSALPEAVQTAREEVLHGATQLDMDAIVARVLARMSRDRLQEVARDMLKPVIEAIVREELNKKL
jgi:CheY-like chemotaxis protein